MPRLRKQLAATVDGRTTMVCLDAAGQIRNLDEEFTTLAGRFQHPPFHIHCRSVTTMYLPGVVEQQRGEANAEIRRRPVREKRKGPDGYEGRVPPPPPLDAEPRIAATMPTGPPTPPAPGRVAPTHRDDLAEWTPVLGRVRRARPERALPEDPQLEVVLTEQGFDGLPRVVSEGQLSRYVAITPGAREVWRGITGEQAGEWAEEFRTGRLFVGLGILANGTHMTDEPTAVRYAAGGAVLHAALMPTARVIGWFELEELIKTTRDSLGPRLARRMASLLAEPGRFAAAMGYDAIELPNGDVVVLNRTALVVAR